MNWLKENIYTIFILVAAMAFAIYAKSNEGFQSWSATPVSRATIGDMFAIVLMWEFVRSMLRK